MNLDTVLYPATIFITANAPTSSFRWPCTRSGKGHHQLCTAWSSEPCGRVQSTRYAFDEPQ